MKIRANQFSEMEFQILKSKCVSVGISSTDRCSESGCSEIVNTQVALSSIMGGEDKLVFFDSSSYAQ